MITRGAISRVRRKGQIAKKRLLLTGFIVVGYSLSLYLFLLYCRELFRYLTIDDYGNMMVLSDAQNYFYNFFFAGLAGIIGLSVGADSLLMRQFHLPQYVRYSITNDFSGLSWYAFYVLSKLALLYGVLGWSFESSETLNLFENYWFLFPLILIVLFFNQWLKIRLFFKNSLTLMVKFGVGFILYAGILAAIPFFDYQSFNYAVLKNTISYNYKIDLPHSKIEMPIERWSLIKDIFVGFPKNIKTDSTVVITTDFLNPLSIDDLSSLFRKSRQLLPEYVYDDDDFRVCVRGDKNTKLNSIKLIMNLARENDIRYLHFMTSERDGIKIAIRPSFSELTSDTTIFHPSLREYLKTKASIKVLRVKLEKDITYVNDTAMDMAPFQKKLKSIIAATKGSYLIDFEGDDKSSYESFIVLLDTIHSTIFNLRKEHANKKWSKDYNYRHAHWEDRALHDTLSAMYPVHFDFLNEKEHAYQNQIPKR